MTRVANTAPGAVLVVMGLVLWWDAAVAAWRWPLGIGAVALGLCVAVRGWRMEVVCEGGGVRVRGLLRTRVVPRGAVAEVSDWPAVRWTDATGRRRWTPLVMFATSPRMLRSAVRHHDEQVRRLRQWVHRRR